MITQDSWSRNIPPHFIFNINQSNVVVKFMSCIQVADTTNQLIFMVGSRKYILNYPRISDSMIILNGNNYACINMIIKPPITNVGTGRNKVVSINGIYEEPVVFSVPRNRNTVMVQWGTRRYWNGIRPNDLKKLASFILTPLDREWINSRSGNTRNTPHVSAHDISYCYSLFNKDEVWNWKHITNLRFLDIEDSFLSYIKSRLSWLYQPNVDIDQATRVLGRFWFSNRQVQYIDPMSSPLATVAAKSKVHFPISRFSPLEESTPDVSWLTYLDVLSTPQSDRAAEIISLSDSAQVTDGKIRYKEKIQ